MNGNGLATGRESPKGAGSGYLAGKEAVRPKENENKKKKKKKKTKEETAKPPPSLERFAPRKGGNTASLNRKS